MKNKSNYYSFRNIFSYGESQNSGFGFDLNNAPEFDFWICTKKHAKAVIVFGNLDLFPEKIAPLIKKNPPLIIIIIIILLLLSKLQSSNCR